MELILVVKSKIIIYLDKEMMECIIMFYNSF